MCLLSANPEKQKSKINKEAQENIPQRTVHSAGHGEQKQKQNTQHPVAFRFLPYGACVFHVMALIHQRSNFIRADADVAWANFTQRIFKVIIRTRIMAVTSNRIP